MQPRPMTDHSRLFLPSSRFFIASPYKTNWARLRRCPCPLLFAPAGRWDPFPSAEGAHEGVSVLVSEQVSSFIQLEDGVIEIVASKLVTGFVENALEARPLFLQAPRASAGTDGERIGDILDGRTLARELLLDRCPDSLQEILVTDLPLQLLLKL